MIVLRGWRLAPSFPSHTVCLFFIVQMSKPQTKVALSRIQDIGGCVLGWQEREFM